MRCSKSLIALTLSMFLAVTEAAEICGVESEDCNGSGLCCEDVPPNFCCTFNPLFTFSVLFKNIPEAAVVGVFTEDSNGNDCGIICASESLPAGGGACGRCPEDLITAGIYALVNKQAPRDELTSFSVKHDEIDKIKQLKGCQPVAPNIARIDGHAFKINYEVPQNVTDEFYSLILAGAKYKDVPQHLLAYEAEQA
jgi:hypothetical protein